MIEEITIKFGTELKPTQSSWKSQLYNPIYRDWFLYYSLGAGVGFLYDFVIKLNLFYRMRYGRH